MDKQSIFNQIKIRAKGAFKRAADAVRNSAAPRYNQSLPYEMNDMIGVAVDYKIGVTKSNDPYVMLYGMVTSPKEYEGRKFTISWFLNESLYRSFEENLTAFVNDVTLLSGKTPTSIDEADQILKEVCEKKTKFLFDTGKERKDKRPPIIYVKGKLFSQSQQEISSESSSSDNVDDNEVPF